MKGGFAMVGRNELHPLAEQLVQYATFERGVAKSKLYAHVCTDVKLEEFNDILEGLVLADRLVLRGDGKYYAK
jgi:hypothetical protein